MSPGMTSPETITLQNPLDMHLHLREGRMLSLTAPHSAAVMAGAVIMPNLVPPVTGAVRMEEYRQEILQAVGGNPAGFQPLMTLFFKEYSERELAEALPGLFAVKLYPHGVTTNSSSGIHSIQSAHSTIKRLEEMGIPLLVHGETGGFVMDREQEFLPVYRWLAEQFPRLRVVMEHITTAAAVSLLEDYENLHATVTAHHLEITLDDVAGGLLQPHLFCKPIAKRPEDREALLGAVLQGHPKLMFGSDSAPHPREAKECCGCAAGVYSSPVLLPRLVELFVKHGAGGQLQGFVSDNARRIHNLHPPQKTVTLVREAWTVPDRYQLPEGPEVIPWGAGGTLAWRVAGVDPSTGN